MSKKFVHLSNEILDKGCKIKNSIVWAFLCYKDKACTLEEISNYYSLSLNQTKLALEKMIEVGAVFSEVVDKKLYYIANPKTYFYSD